MQTRIHILLLTAAACAAAGCLLPRGAQAGDSALALVSATAAKTPGQVSLTGMRRGNVRLLKRAFTPANRRLGKQLGLDRWYLAERTSGADASAAASDPSIERVDPIRTVHLAQVPNDALFSSQWALRNTGRSGGKAGADIHAVDAWDMTTGSPSIIVGVVDSGVDSTHPDLSPNLLPGYNIPLSSTDTTDTIGHGTSCASIIGAATNNQQFIAGVCWNCKLLPVKVVNGYEGEDIWLAQGIVWAVDHGAKVLSVSLVMDTDSQVVRAAVGYAIQSNVTVVAAMGNDWGTQVRYPAAIPEVIAAGATDKTDTPAPFSDSGPHIDVAAPGVDVLTLNLGGGTTGFTGTSAATPFVSGVCALVLSLDSSVTPAQMQDLIRQGADDLPPYGFDTKTGYGRLNAAMTLRAMADRTPPTQPQVSVAGPYTDSATTLSFSWTACQDPETGVTGYEYCIGTASTPQSVRSWAYAGTGTTFTATGLNLPSGQELHVSVRAINGVRGRGAAGISGAVIYAPIQTSISTAWGLADGNYITLGSAIATASFTDRTWVRDMTGLTCIAVAGAWGVGEGNVVRVSGRLQTDGCIREIQNACLSVLSSGSAPTPIVMAERDLGGHDTTGATPAITGAMGPYNVGLLVKTAGKVSASQAGQFILDDSSRDGGVTVLTGGWTAPPDGAFVSVTGIVECRNDTGDARPVIRIRKDTDLTRLDAPAQ